MKPVIRWWPVALSSSLRHQPLACQLFDTPLVVFRGSDGQPVALPDRCPHRFAPLSGGTVCDGQIQCPYHGWRFAADGHCTRVPGTDVPASDKPLLVPRPTSEAHGLVWVSPDNRYPDLAPTAPAGEGLRLDSFWMTDRVQCSLLEGAENFLDAFHTHFVHAGWIRRDRNRQRVKAVVRPIEDGIEALYSEEGKQSGLISQLLERDRGISIGRFRMPCLAEIEYRDRQDAISLLVSAWLIPGGDGQLCVFARVATPRGWLPAAVKHRVLKRLFNVILRQDRDMLEQVSANRKRFGDQAVALDGPQDLLGPGIRQLIETGQPLNFAERQMDIRL